MNIRTAEEKDIDRILDLLSQVLEIHAAIRPDYFKPGTTKYSREELNTMLKDDNRLIYVAADENDSVMGYAFCEIRDQKHRDNLVPFRSVYIDDLCVDKKLRGKHIGQELFNHVRQKAKELGCYEISLNVWEGNDNARRFYENIGFKPRSTTMEFILGQ
ncbi:MAG: GNAT family N-acetyltransferase [Flexilinea sp.]|nr:GNAT family N-acetyltransferase [Flexilinea sp.]